MADDRRPLGVAVVGCGLIGRKRAAALPEGTRLVAATDLVDERARRLVDDLWPDASVATDPLDAIRHPEVDLVVVATTHDQLPVLGGLAVDHGRHLLLEKPGAHRLPPLEDLARRAADAGVVVRVGYNHRFHPGLRRLHELATSGRYGPLLWLRGRYGHGGRLGYEQEWRADPALSGGGELIDQGSHLIDLVRWLAGDVDLVHAETTTAFWKMAVEDNAFLALRPRSGGFAWMHASWTEWKNTFHLEATYATAKIEVVGLGGSYGTERLTLHEMSPTMGPPETTAWEFTDPDDSWALETADVVSSVRGGTGIGADIDDAVAVLRLIDEVYTT